MSTTDRIVVMQAIDRFVEMANAHPSTPVHEYPEHPEHNFRYTFSADTPGKNVTRIVVDTNGQRSVHMFVDNITGDVFKAAGWKAPAKGVRYNIVTDFDEVERNFYWSGSYLYADWKKV